MNILIKFGARTLSVRMGGMIVGKWGLLDWNEFVMIRKRRWMIRKCGMMVEKAGMVRTNGGTMFCCAGTIRAKWGIMLPYVGTIRANDLTICCSDRMVRTNGGSICFSVGTIRTNDLTICCSNGRILWLYLAPFAWDVILLLDSNSNFENTMSVFPYFYALMWAVILLSSSFLVNVWSFFKKRIMKFVGMWIKALPFPHFHEPISFMFPVNLQHPFFIQFLTLLFLNWGLNPGYLVTYELSLF